MKNRISILETILNFLVCLLRNDRSHFFLIFVFLGHVYLSLKIGYISVYNNNKEMSRSISKRQVDKLKSVFRFEIRLKFLKNYLHKTLWKSQIYGPLRKLLGKSKKWHVKSTIKNKSFHFTLDSFHPKSFF